MLSCRRIGNDRQGSGKWIAIQGCRNEDMANGFPQRCDLPGARHSPAPPVGQSIRAGCLLEPRLRRRVSIRRHDGGALGERLAARAGELIVSAPEVVEKREGKGAKEDGREPEAAHGGSAGVREAALWAALGIARVGVLAASANHFARRYHGMRKERNAAAGQSHAEHPGRRLGLPGCGR